MPNLGAMALPAWAEQTTFAGRRPSPPRNGPSSLLAAASRNARPSEQNQPLTGSTQQALSLRSSLLAMSALRRADMRTFQRYASSIRGSFPDNSPARMVQMVHVSSYNNPIAAVLDEGSIRPAASATELCTSEVVVRSNVGAPWGMMPLFLAVEYLRARNMLFPPMQAGEAIEAYVERRWGRLVGPDAWTNHYAMLVGHPASFTWTNMPDFVQMDDAFYSLDAIGGPRVVSRRSLVDMCNTPQEMSDLCLGADDELDEDEIEDGSWDDDEEDADDD